MDLDTTIVALSSPQGHAARALIRVSGTLAFAGARVLGLRPQSRTLCKATLAVHPSTVPVLLGSFPAGASYTGQDTIEIQLPNNPYLIQRVITLLIEATQGRQAEAGEFTARAFFHGRISLSEAEGVCATISANNDAELLGASFLRKGVLTSIVQPLAAEITQTLARIEAEIDFAEEEDVVVISQEARLQSITKCIDTISSTLSGCIPMATLRQLPHVVLAGAPNSGKSTLYNTLLGKRRVVVSTVAGTTRDAIAEPVVFHDKEALLIDIAGTEEALDQLGSAAQQSASNAIASADLVLWCIAPDQISPPPPSHAHVMIVHTKGDLQGSGANAISAVSNIRVDELLSQVAKRLASIPTPREDALAILPRHEQSLRSALSHLHEARNNLISPELTATSLRLSLDAIGVLTGNITPDEVLTEVFATFCIGK